MGHQLSHMCEMKEKNFLFLRDDHEHEWPSFIYKRKPNVWWVTNYHICVRWKKKFFVSPWPWTWVTIYYIYIRWDLMCDGSPTIMNVWDGRKNFFVSPWPWTWVTIYYIYKMRPNVWWVTNYHECVRWKKKFFWFSMTMNMSDHLLYI